MTTATTQEKRFDKLQPYLSETASIKYQIKVEIALVKTLADKKICSAKTAKEIEQAANAVTPSEVYQEEQRIKHNVRALVNCIRKKVSKAAKPYIHFTATSNDIISTSEAIRLKDAVKKALVPELLQLEKTLIDIARREKKTLQIGRTHGQHAEPITFGYAIAGYASRLGGRILAIKKAAENLRGKFSGAVGAYNASSLLIKNPEDFEKRILAKLNVRPASHSTQLVEAEYVTDLMHAVISTTSVLANIADDMRHLQRSEINEIGEKFESEQVGSSTMPHKRNPINFENVKSMWKEFIPRMLTVYMDQISEHQRDLTNSASSRFNTEIIASATIMTIKLKKVMRQLTVDKASLKKNFDQNKKMVSAEPSYIMLAYAGHPDAHETVRKTTLKSEKTGKPFVDLLLSDQDLKPYLKKISKAQLQTIKNPEAYTGIAIEKTEKVCKTWAAALKLK